MRKEKIFGTLVIVGILIVACIPIISADPPPGDDIWVVTNDVEPRGIQEHDFYSECTEHGCADMYTNHSQVWWYDPCLPQPVARSDYYVNTTIEAWAVSSGDNVILHVKTMSGTHNPYVMPEEVRWTMINGGFYAVYFRVQAILSDANGTGSVDVVIDGDREYMHLGLIQELQMALTFMGAYPQSPGQKDYWVETDYDEFAGKSYTYVDLDDANYGGQNISEPTGPHNLTWWTDKEGVNETIANNSWHINTKALVWVEPVDTYNLKVCVKIYGESNYNPEQINWTVNYATGAPDPYFNVDIDTEAADWNVNVALGDDPQFKELGSIEDPIWLDLVFHKG